MQEARSKKRETRAERQEARSKRQEPRTKRLDLFAVRFLCVSAPLREEGKKKQDASETMWNALK